MLGVLGGLDMPDGQLRAWAESADALYAADSAGSRLIRLGFKPVVVGDLDSFDFSLESGAERIVRDSDPNRTDCSKILSLVEQEGHKSMTLAGLEGDLLDHVLSSLSVVARSRLAVRLVLRSGLAWVLRSGDSVTVRKGFGRRVSLLPLERSTGVNLSGVLWEVTESVMEPAGFHSVSNEGTGDVHASVSSGAVLLFVSRAVSEGPEW